MSNEQNADVLTMSTTNHSMPDQDSELEKSCDPDSSCNNNTVTESEHNPCCNQICDQMCDQGSEQYDGVANDHDDTDYLTKDEVDTNNVVDTTSVKTQDVETNKTYDNGKDKDSDVASDVPLDSSQPPKPIFSWYGQRPFAGAVYAYINDILNPAIAQAMENLVKNPHWKYSVVDLPLFDTIDVLCHDQFGNEITKRFPVHEAHYGPIIGKPRNSNKQQKWFDFYN